jgi:outer membrane lipoprotein SlyB
MGIIMANQCVVAVFESGIRAKLAVEKLTAAGYPKSKISTVARSVKGQEADVTRALQFGDEMERDATLGAGIGALVGALGGATAIAAGASVLVIAGPIIAITGAVVGGLIGAMTGWGVHHNHAEQYQRKIESGKVLVLVLGDDPLQIAEAEKLLRLSNPEELHLHAKTDDADDPQVVNK